MKELSSCYKEGSPSREEVQELTQPHELPSQPVQDPSETNNGGNDDFNEQHLFGQNEPVNLVLRNNNEHRDDRPQNGVMFRWLDIFLGTEEFETFNYLGQGSFGSVYRCDFRSTDKVGAAKIQSLKNGNGLAEFRAEITTLNAANHPNVIKLLGKSLDRGKRVIVYEFMPRGSVDHYIYAYTRPREGRRLEYAVLTWGRRMNIAVGVAKALVYLHEELKTVHRDVKLANVLLDEDFVPKLTDFGLATRIVENEDGVEQESKINPFQGTPCLAPETIHFGLVSSKSDVYCYGVFLFKLFTGRKSFDGEKPVEERNLTSWLSAVESREEYRFPVEGLIRLFQAARMCMNPQAIARPNMRVVESMVRQAAACKVPEVPSVTRRLSI